MIAELEVLAGDFLPGRMTFAIDVLWLKTPEHLIAGEKVNVREAIRSVERATREDLLGFREQARATLTGARGEFIRQHTLPDDAVFVAVFKDGRRLLAVASPSIVQEIRRIALGPTERPPAIPEGSFFCQYCQALCPPGALQCPGCGAPVTRSEVASAPAETAGLSALAALQWLVPEQRPVGSLSPRQWLNTAGGCGCLLVILVIGWIFIEAVSNTPVAAPPPAPVSAPAHP